MRQDRLDDVSVVIDTELVRHGEQQRVSHGDSLVACQLLYEDVGFGRVGAAKDRPRLLIDVADLVRSWLALPK